MELPHAAAFTDTYLPTINGVTYTVQAWRDAYRERGGRMDVVYPKSRDYTPENGEHPVRSLPFPFYEGYRVGMPRVPDAVASADVVHVHSPFGVGMSGLRVARKADVPIVASYHTPTGEYAEYIASNGRLERTLRSAADSYERWFFDRADVVLTPSERTRDDVREVGVETPVEVVSNGVDTATFRPVETSAFRERHDLPDGPLVGYTGRHGYEKCLGDAIAAVEGLPVTLVFGGDGPARADLEARAATSDADVRFLGFLDREELPAFYSILDAFVLPSPVETQGLVALEANACGTPVVGVDSGALQNTIHEGETGYTYPPGDVDAFEGTIERVLDERDTLAATCLDRRDAISVDASVARLAAIYRDLCPAIA